MSVLCPACGVEVRHGVLCGYCCPLCGKRDRDYNGSVCQTCFENAHLRRLQAGAEIACQLWPVPKRYREARLSQLPNTQYRAAYKVLERFVRALEQHDKSKGLCLYITGVYGSGKTFAAAAVLNAAQRVSLSTAFCPSAVMVETIRAAMRYDSEESANDILHQLGTVDVVALDDIGTQAKQDLATEWLFRIVDDRYANELATVVTSSRPIADLGSDARFTAMAHRIMESDLICRFPMLNLRQGGQKLGESAGSIPFGEES